MRLLVTWFPLTTTAELLRFLLVALFLSLANARSSVGPCAHPPPCLLLEEASCHAELSQGPHGPKWRARYFASDGSELSCSSDSLLLCDGERKNISCPAGWTIKIWFATFKRAPPGFCSSAPPAPFEIISATPKPCDALSVLWDLAHMCDGRPHCVINTTALAKDERCEGGRYLRTEFSCISNTEPYSPTQVHFFLMILIAIIALFVISVAALLITVHVRRKRDAYPLTSLHAPLTENENPEL